MPDGAALIGRGAIDLTIATDPPSAAIATLKLQYTIQTSGITFYPVANTNPTTPSGSLFTVLTAIVPTGSKVTAVSGSGSLNLVSLTAAPQDAFRAVTLNYIPGSVASFTLKVVQTDPFARRANTFFKDLNLTFTEVQSGVPFKVEGGVNAIVFDSAQPVPLVAELTNDSRLVFRYKGGLLAPLAIAQLGNLDLTTLEVGAKFDTLSRLQALYTFDEGSGTTVRDVSGVGTALDLTIDNPATTVEWVPGGGLKIKQPTLIRATQPATKIIQTCRSSGEITIEAWIRLDSSQVAQPLGDLRGPDKSAARIITLSSDYNNRYFTLGHGQNNGTRADLYTVRLRTTDTSSDASPNGRQNQPLATAAGTAIAGLSHVVYTRNKDGLARIYINGAKKAEGALTGTLFPVYPNQNSDQTFRLALGNELVTTQPNPWIGEYRLVALYDRALSEEEVNQNYYSPVTTRGSLTIPTVPAPLGTLPVEIKHFPERSLITANVAGLPVTPQFQFDQVALVWEKTPTTVKLLTNSVTATLWKNALPFAATLPPAADGLILALNKPSGTSTALSLKDLGSATLTQLSLYTKSATTPPTWELRTDARTTLTILPPPLKDALPTGIVIQDGLIWLTINPVATTTAPLPIVEQFVFDRANLQFNQDASDRWTVQGDIATPLLGQSLPLVPSFVTDGNTRLLSLDWTLPPVTTPAQPAIRDILGKLQLARYSLKAIPSANGMIWQFAMAGQVAIGVTRLDATGTANEELAGVLAFNADGRIVGGTTASPSTARLDGTSSTLRSLADLVFAGDFQLKNNRYLLNGKLTLIPQPWSPLQVNSDTQIAIDPVGIVSFSNPVPISLPDFGLQNSQVAIANGHLTLSGIWLGQPTALTGMQRDNQFLWQGEVPFDLPLPPLLKLADWIKPCQDAGCQQRFNTTLQVELSAGGFLTRVNGRFQQQIQLLVLSSPQPPPRIVHDLTLPEFTLFAPPKTRNAMVGELVTAFQAQADEIFANQLTHDADYYLSPNSATALIYHGARSHLPQETAITTLPAVFNAGTDVQVADEQTIFQLRQSSIASARLTIDLSHSLAELETGYLNFLAELAKRETAGQLLPGAARVIKQRIAERLPLPHNRALFYHYGMVLNPEKNEQYIDLQQGMRLRVDFQNYQSTLSGDTTPGKPTGNGFVGSGTTYYQLASYLHPVSSGASPFQYLLGFDSFVAKIQAALPSDPTQLGAIGGAIDLLKAGFRQPYYRLFYPSNFADANPKGAERAIAIAGAATLADLQTATDLYKKNSTISSATNSRVSFFFRGRVVVIPEITVFVQDQPIYVPVGTTIRQLIERYDGLPAASLSGQHLQAFRGKFRPRRLIHEGVDNTPLYKFINLDQYQRYDDGTDEFDLPVIKGDRFYV